MGCTLQLAIVIHIVMLLQIPYACISLTKPDKHLTIAAGLLPFAHNAGHSTSNKYHVTLQIGARLALCT